MEFDLQRFGYDPTYVRGNTTKDGSIIEATICNPDHEYYSDNYVDIKTTMVYSTYRALNYTLDFILYKTQHKWGGGIYS